MNNLKQKAASIFLILFISSFFSLRAYAQNYSPESCPVVGNTNSYIYHVPGGQFYQRMLIKNKGRDNRRCFNTESEAVKNGYRKSKR